MHRVSALADIHQPSLTLLPLDTKNMKSFMLFRENITWERLSTLTFPGFRHHDVRVHVAYFRQTGDYRSNISNHELAIPLADMPEIERLRSAGSSWESIGQTRYPDRTTQQVRHTFIQQCKDYSLERYDRTVFGMSPADLAKIRHLARYRERDVPRHISRATKPCFQVADQKSLGSWPRHVRNSSRHRFQSAIQCPRQNWPPPIQNTPCRLCSDLPLTRNEDVVGSDCASDVPKGEP